MAVKRKKKAATKKKTKATKGRAVTKKKSKKKSVKGRKAAPAKKKVTKKKKGRRGAARTASRGGRAAKVSATNITPEDARFVQEHADALSRTTQSAKWLNSPDEHEDKPGQSLATRSHEVIQRWAEERGAKPATIEGTEHEGRAGVLRFNFPGYEGGDQIKEIGWEEWFQTFDERALVFLFQEHKRDGAQSNFFQLDSPMREQA